MGRIQVFMVRNVRTSDYDQVLDMIWKLLHELGEEGDEAGTIDKEKIKIAWNNKHSRSIMLLAFDTSNELPIGILTLEESFAVYAGGSYGIINEMYVEPEFREKKVGRLLLEEMKRIGQQRNWKRIDVTAPESDRWERTRRFYEKNGFVFTGPKMKILLNAEEVVCL